MTFSLAHATSVVHEVEGLSEDDRMIYYSVVSMCERSSISREYAEKSALWASAVNNASLLGSAIKQRNPLKTSERFQTLTSSMGFHLALNRCYGSNEDQKLLFFYTILSLDISGKFVGWVG